MSHLHPLKYEGYYAFTRKWNWRIGWLKHPSSWVGPFATYQEAINAGIEIQANRKLLNTLAK